MTESHEKWEGLAVGYALDALEPEDEQAFLAHLPGCAACARTLAEMRGVAAALADTVEPEEPPEELRRAILEAAGPRPPAHRDGPPPGQPPAGGPPGAARLPPEAVPAPRPPLWRRPAVLVAGAAAAVLVAAGVSAWALTSRGQPGGVDRSPVVMSCLEDVHCQRVPLRAGDGGAVMAVALVRDGRVSVVSEGMAPDDSSASTYVLWQMTPSGQAVGVTTFDVTGHSPRVVVDAALARPLDATSKLAVSLEKGRAIPARPSAPIAVGEVSG